MKNLILIFILITLNLLFFQPNPGNCTNAGGGLPGQFLIYGISGKAMGMGKAFVGQADDATAGYWNPAGISQLQNLHFSMSATSLYDAVYLSHLAVAGPLFREKGISYSVNTICLWADDIERTEWGQNQSIKFFDESNNFSWTETATLFSLAFRPVNWKPSIEMGATFKYLHRSLLFTHASGTGWDLGIRVRPLEKPIFLGFQIQNLIKPIVELDTLCQAINMGFSWLSTFKSRRITYNADWFRVLNSKTKYQEFRTGFDLALTNYFNLRGGYCYKTKFEDSEIFAGVGISIRSLVSAHIAAKRSRGFGMGNASTPQVSLDFNCNLSYENILETAKKSKDISYAKFLLHKVLDENLNNNLSRSARIILADLEYEDGKIEKALKYYAEALNETNSNPQVIKSFIDSCHLDTESCYNYLKCITMKYFPILQKLIFDKDRDSENEIKNQLEINLLLEYLSTRKNSEEDELVYDTVDIIREIVDVEWGKKDNKKLIKKIDSLKILSSKNSGYRKQAYMYLYGIGQIVADEINDAESVFNEITQGEILYMPYFFGIKDQLVVDNIHYIQSKIKFKNDPKKLIIELSKIKLLYPESGILSLIDDEIKDSLSIKNNLDLFKPTLSFSPDTIPRLKLIEKPKFKERFCFPYQMIRDKRGNFYITEAGKKRIRIIQDDGKTVIDNIQDKDFKYPSFLVQNSPNVNNDFIISDSRKNVFWVYELSSKKIKSHSIPNYINCTITNGENPEPAKNEISIPYDLVRLNSQSILAIDLRNNRIIRFKQQKSATSEQFNLRNNSVQRPDWFVSMDFINDTLYLADWGNQRILSGMIHENGGEIDDFKFPHPTAENMLWFPVFLRGTTASINQIKTTYIFVLYQSVPSQKNLIVKFDSRGRVLGKISTEPNISSFYLETENNKDYIYTVQRMANGKIKKFRMEE